MRLWPWLEIPAYVALALVCAWCANAFAGPTRRLSWWLKEPAHPASSPMAPAATPMALPAPTPPALSPPAQKFIHPIPAMKAAAPISTPSTPAPAPDSKADVMARFPPLVHEAEAELRGDEAVWLQAHGVLFLDARRTAMYLQGHIPGAKSVSAWEDGLQEKVDQLALFTVDLKLPVVVYCSGGDCHDSHLVAQKLWLAGFRNVRIYTDGYPDWEARKLPLTQGTHP